MKDSVCFKKFLLLPLAAVLFISAFVACNSTPEQKMNHEAGSTPTDSLINNPSQTVKAEYQKGAQLVAANDCLTCHKIADSSIGPSYNRIAAKYEMIQGNIENLAHKIIAGGYGRWGTVAMTPHPNVSQGDAEEMVKYILSLRQ